MLEKQSHLPSKIMKPLKRSQGTLRGMIWQELRRCAVPLESMVKREEVLHQGCLAGELNFDRTISETAHTRPKKLSSGAS